MIFITGDTHGRFVFFKSINQGLVDKSTEAWLDQIENKLAYDKWYVGHYHTEKKIDRLEIMFENFAEFGNKRIPFTRYKLPPGIQ